jgi:catechol 2,3-dioxygenase-like lactoylglutathione lyase family enzyme
MAQAAIGRLDEVHLNVEDLEGMRRFYTDMLGFEAEFYHEGKMVGLRTGGAALVLTASKTRANGVAFALDCTGIEALLEGLVAKRHDHQAAVGGALGRQTRRVRRPGGQHHPPGGTHRGQTARAPLAAGDPRPRAVGGPAGCRHPVLLRLVVNSTT